MHENNYTGLNCMKFLICVDKYENYMRLANILFRNNDQFYYRFKYKIYYFLNSWIIILGKI